MGLKPVYALIGDLFFATKIVKSAKAVGLEARAFDTAERLMQASREKEPGMIIMDCGSLEREAFQLLKELRSDEKLSRIPRLGYLSHSVADLKNQMRAAGCDQVFLKTEFTRELENLLVRYGGGFPSRI